MLTVKKYFYLAVTALFMLCTALSFAQVAQADSLCVEQEMSVTDILFGNATLAFYIASSIFVFAAVFLSSLIRAQKGVKENPNSPDEFSWSYFLKDTSVKMTISLLTNLFMARLVTVWADDVSQDMQLALSVAIGFGAVGIDKLFNILHSKTNLLDVPKN
jgi:heme/copper-type cytochrome/quinol oxidase subunit 3